MTEDRIGEVLKVLKEIQTDVGSISRAIYGDHVNKVPGLIERQIQDELEIKRLKDAKKKFIWAATGFVIALQVVEILILKMFQ